MVSASLTTDARPGRMSRLVVLAGVLLAWTSAGIYLVAVAGGARPATPLLFVVADALVVAGVGTFALALTRTGYRRSVGWLTALTISLAGYVAIVSMATVFAGTDGAAARWIVALEGAWFMFPITISGLCALVSAEELAARPRGTRGWRTLYALLAVAALIVGLGAVDPTSAYPHLQAPLGTTLLGSTTATVIFGVLTIAWMLASVIAPVVVWRTAVHRAGLVRARLTIVAIGAMAPVLTLVTCVLLGATLWAGLVDEALATAVLIIAFCLPPLVSAGAIVVGSSARDDGVTGSAVRSVTWVLRGLWLLVSAQLACVLAAALAQQTRTSAVMATSAVSIVLCIGFIALYSPVSTRVLRFIGAAAEHAPSPDLPRLDDVLSPREREVLGLVAEGHANRAIAARLHVSERTIDSHVSSIFSKLGLDASGVVNRRVRASTIWYAAQSDQDIPADRDV